MDLGGVRGRAPEKIVKLHNLCTCILATAIPVAAQAGPSDSFGVDADSASRAMAVTADVQPVSAASVNPARLIDAKGIEAAFDIAVGDSRLTVQHEDSGQDVYVGYGIGIAAQLPLGEYRDRLYAGITAHIPHDGLYDVRNTVASEPVILHTGSDARRFSLDAAVAVRVWRRIAVGAGIHIMPAVKAHVNIGLENSSERSDSHVQVDVRAAPVLGVFAEPVPGLTLGFSWRGAVRLDLDVPAEIDLGDSLGTTHVELTGAAFTEPHLLRLGVRYDFSALTDCRLAHFAAEIDAEYRHYVDPVATSADVRFAMMNGDAVGDSVPWQDFDDAWALRAALSWMPADWLTVSAGYAFEKSPIPAQRSVFNVLDADRNQVAFGATAWLPDEWLGGFDAGFSTAARFDLYAPRDMEKFDFLPGNPGFPAISLRGFAFAWHAAILVRFQ